MINRLVILSGFTLGLAAMLSAAPQLSLSTTSLGPIQIVPGTNGTSQVVTAKNIGTGSLSLSAGGSPSWLAPTIAAGGSCGGGTSGTCYPITIALNTSSLAAGSYTGYVLVSDANAIDSPQTIAVSINVAANIPSSVTFYVTPKGGAMPTTSLRITTPGSVTGTATTQSGGNWLSLVSGAPFFTGYAIQVVAQSGQTAGTYTGSLALSGTSTQTINVTLIVTSSPIINPVTTPVLLSGSGGNASAVVTFSNAGAGTLNITGATATSSQSSFLSAAVNSGGTSITITAAPGTLAAGLYSGSVTLTSNAANNSQISVPVVYQAEASNTPLIYSGGVTNIGTFTAGSAAPGEILAVFGDQLAAPGTSAQNPGLPPLATTLGKVQVLVNGTAAPLYFASPGQVNFQLPYEVPVGQMATVQVVSNGTNGNLRPVNVVSTAPTELIWPASVIAGGYAIAVNTDYSLVLPSPVAGFTTHAAKVGDTLTIYCEAFGQTSPLAVTGAAAGSNPLEQIQNVTVTFGGAFSGSEVTAPAGFAGLTPTAVGLYQVNVQIPPGVPISNAVPIVINLNGASSNSGLIAISQ